jgi:hypothetical protein
MNFIFEKSKSKEKKEKEKSKTNDYFNNLLTKKMIESKSKITELKNMTHLNQINRHQKYKTSKIGFRLF